MPIADYGTELLLLLATMVLLILYYRKLRIYTPVLKGNYDVALKSMGKALPPHPNGWYVMCRSQELKNG